MLLVSVLGKTNLQFIHLTCNDRGEEQSKKVGQWHNACNRGRSTNSGWHLQLVAAGEIQNSVVAMW
jgi:hypothetical protein